MSRPRNNEHSACFRSRSTVTIRGVQIFFSHVTGTSTGENCASHKTSACTFELFWRCKLRDVRPRRLFVQVNPPLGDQKFSFTEHFVANPATHFSKKNERNIRPKRKEHKQKRTVCGFKCWLNCQLASFEALRSLEKTIDDPTSSWSAVPVLRLVPQKPYPSNCVISNVFSYHIGGTCPRKEFSWSRNGAFFGTEKRPRRTSPVQAL